MEEIWKGLYFLLLWCCHVSQFSAQVVSITEKDAYLAGHVLDTSYMADWLSCTMACQDQHNCVSYNYNKLNGACELNDDGIHEAFSGKETLIRAQGFIFHQIRVGVLNCRVLTMSS